ncbi:hypothetical protein [Cohnella rhizosphaerae]|uniref:Uncharacterized protein n=1 Tax=Cohnella rhizosphaerae TaxID=1457232 RepID=A0A9X4KRU5_9BACL|nr:hypothetical protein [Cohnella rhizosphaerae]MDG0809071.1 hypothetical protein [Cohnella rhizosphaerae]
MARVHLLRDFKLREPQRYQRLRGDILTLLLGNLRTADKASSRRIAAQILLLCKDALPALDRSYADITTDFYAPGIDYYRPDDLPVLHDLIAQWCVYSVEPEQEEMYHRFLDDLAVQSPESMILQRDAEGIPVGLFINVLLHRDNARMLEPYFADELGECFTRPELNVEPDRADTYFPILAAATDRRADCTREELVGHLALRGLSMLGEGMRAVLIVTNEHLKHFLTNLGFHMRRARTRQFDFSQGEAHVLTVDLRAGQFADWVLSFIAKADGPPFGDAGPRGPYGESASHGSAGAQDARQPSIAGQAGRLRQVRDGRPDRHGAEGEAAVDLERCGLGTRSGRSGGTRCRLRRASPQYGSGRRALLHEPVHLLPPSAGGRLPISAYSHSPALTGGRLMRS